MSDKEAFWRDVWEHDYGQKRETKPCQAVVTDDRNDIVTVLFNEVARNEGHKLRLYIGQSDEDNVMDMSLHAEALDDEALPAGTESSDTDDFLLDSGSSCHIVRNREKMRNVKETSRKVLVGKNQVLEAGGLGEIIVVDEHETAMQLQDLLVIEGFARNIVSMKCLVEAGCKFESNGKKVVFTKSDFKLVANREKDSGFYVFKFKKCNSWEEANDKGRRPEKVDINNAHRLFGHVGETTLQKTWKARGITLTGDLHCEACCLTKAKQKRTAKVRKESVSKPNKLVYVDTTGPFNTTMGGNRY